MQRQISRLSDHFIVCGFGRIGRPVCEKLQAEGIPCVVIEGDHDALETARERGFLAIRGNATEDDVLIDAGIERARGIVCAVNSDADNIVIALGARELRPDIIITARVDEDGATRKIRRAGANQVVSPFRTAAHDIANSILRPHVTAFLERTSQADGGFELSEVSVGEKVAESWTVGRLRAKAGRNIVFVAIKKADGTTNLGPSDIEMFESGDVLIVAGEPASVRRVGDLLGGSDTEPLLRAHRELTSWGPLA